MGLRKGQNNGNHGAKGRSGRKPKAFTLLKRRIEEEKKDDAEYAFALYASVMRDENASIELRLDCANWIAERVLGKPKEHIDTTIHGAIPVQAIDYQESIREMKPQESVDE